MSSGKAGSSVLYSTKDPELIELMAVARRLLVGSLLETHTSLAGLEEPVTGS